MELTDEQRRHYGDTFDHLENVGWSVMLISPDPDAPDETPWFAYTIGLWHNYRHPELLVFGLDPDLMHAMLNVAGEEMRDDGRTLVEGEFEPRLLGGGVDVTPRRVQRRWHPAVVGYGREVYRLLDGTSDEFPLLQLFWPGAVDGKFPWEEDAAEAIKQRQPLLYLDDPKDAMAEAIEEMLHG